MIERLLTYLHLKPPAYNVVSITNIVLYAVAIKALILPDIPTAIVFCAAAANYAHKRFEITRSEAFKASIRAEQLIDLERQISQVKSMHESVLKAAEESKKLLSQANMAASFMPRGMR